MHFLFLYNRFMQHVEEMWTMCPSCGTKTKHSRRVEPLATGDLVMVIVTFGFWVLLRKANSPSFRCKKCGHEIRARLTMAEKATTLIVFIFAMLFLFIRFYIFR